jgi:integrase
MNAETTMPFGSRLASHLAAFVAEKRLTGYRYRTGAVYLRDLDRFLAASRPEAETEGLGRELVELWTAKRPNESDNTHFNRVCIIRQVAVYLNRVGIAAYILPRNTGKPSRFGFIPRIFTHAEVERLFDLLDRLPRDSNTPLRHVVLPELFRTLYGCGLRVGEALGLTVGTVDLNQGVILVRHAKGDIERLVPVSPSLLQRLRIYGQRLGQRPLDAQFFPGGRGKRLTHAVVYKTFRTVLWQMRIPHVGRGHGPRIHDLRHTFAVHRLLQWYQEGADLAAMLPLLSAYLGHQGMGGTQRYLHLVPDLFPEVVRRLEADFGQVIPGGEA